MQKEKIPVIDDEEVILRLSKDILTKIHYQVKTTSDGRQGLKLFDGERFDFINGKCFLLDVS